jgi:TolB protein
MSNITPIQKILIAILGLGFLGLFCLIAYSIIVVANEPVATQTPINTQPFLELETATLESLTLPTQTITPLPIVELIQPTLEQIPTPIPSFNDTPPPSGKIVFACYINQIDQICLINSDGSGRKQLTNFKATAFYPSVSPDGQTIFFSSRDFGNYEIYSIDINGNNLQKITNNIGALYAPELSPNGEWIVFTKHGDGLWLIRPDGSGLKRLTNKDDIDPSWSPDGSMISFASSRAGARQLFVMNADGSNIQQVTDLNNMGGRNTWSPDGTKLAFYRGEFGNRNIFVINVDGTGLERLTNGGDNLGPSWSPDGNWIAFTSFRDGNNEIYIIHPDGTGLTRITNSAISDWQPRWGN